MRRALADNRGITLLELLIVLMILSLILTAAVKTWDVTLERGRNEATRRRLDQLATAITGTPDYVVAGRRVDFGFVGDVGRVPNSLSELGTAPAITPPESSQWRGPYVRSAFNESPHAYMIDGWGDTIVYNRDSLFLRSYGGTGLADRTRWVTRQLGYSTSDLMYNSVDGMVVDVRGVAPPADDSLLLANVRVVIQYPVEGKMHEQRYIGPLTNGQFSFTNIPQGTRLMKAMYIHWNPPPVETIVTQQQVTVYPGIGAHDVTLRLNVDWGAEQ